MSLVRGADVNNVDAWIAQEALHRRIEVWNTALMGVALGPFAVGAHDRDDRTVWLTINGLDHPCLRDIARADQTLAQIRFSCHVVEVPFEAKLDELALESG